MPALPTTSFAKQPPRIPLPVIAGAVVAGLFAAAAAALMMRPSPNGSGPPTTSPADTALDVKWRTQRADGDDCVATFEVTQGSANGSRFVAFVMDSSGEVMAGDSTAAMDAVRGKQIDFRFRRVNCSKIGDWQLQVLSPKAPTK